MRVRLLGTQAALVRTVWSALLACCLCGTSVGADEETRPAEYSAFEKRFYPLVRAENLPAIEKLAEAERKRWAGKDPELYARMIVEIVNILDNASFGGDRARGVVQSLAATALSSADRFDLKTEWRLVVRYSRPMDKDGKKVVGKEWVHLRTDQTRRWLHAWSRLNREIDPKWALEKRPRWRDYDTTAKDGGKEGERLHQEAVLEYNKQLRLKELHDLRIGRAERFLIHIHRKSPRTPKILRGLLDEYLPKDPARERILKAVEVSATEDGRKRREADSGSSGRDD